MGNSATSSLELAELPQTACTFSMACTVALSSSLTGLPGVWPSHTLAAYASKYMYFDLCSGFSLLPSLNKASTRSSEIRLFTILRIIYFYNASEMASYCIFQIYLQLKKLQYAKASSYYN